jgi:hypothetical protein
VEIRPEIEFGPRPVRAEKSPRSLTGKPARNQNRPAVHFSRNYSASPAGKRPEAENGPRPARSRISLPAPAAMRPETEKQPSGPLALGASRAPGRNLGLGRESQIPPGLKLGPVSVSRSSRSDGCATFPAEQNRASAGRANPSVISLRSLSLTCQLVPFRCDEAQVELATSMFPCQLMEFH